MTLASHLIALTLIIIRFKRERIDDLIFILLYLKPRPFSEPHAYNVLPIKHLHLKLNMSSIKLISLQFLPHPYNSFQTIYIAYSQLHKLNSWSFRFLVVNSSGIG